MKFGHFGYKMRQFNYLKRSTKETLILKYKVE